MQSDLQKGPSQLYIGPSLIGGWTELHISPCHIWTHMQFVQLPMCLATYMSYEAPYHHRLSIDDVTLQVVSHLLKQANSNY